MKDYVKLLTKENNGHILLFIILNMTLVLAETISIALIPLFIDFVVSDEPILPKYHNFFENAIKTENKKDLLNIGIYFFILIFFIKNLFYLSVIFYQATLKKKFNCYLKKKFLGLYIFAPFEIMKSYNTSEILRNADGEVQDYVTNFFYILKFSKDILLFLCIFFLLLVVDARSTFVALIILIFCLISYFLFFYKHLHNLGLKRLKSINAVYQWINQTSGAIKEIKITKKENKVLDIFSEKVGIYEQSKKITEIIGALPIALFEFVFLIIILFLIKFLYHVDSINALPAVSLYIVAFIRLLPIVSRVGSNISVLRSFSPSVQLLNKEIGKLEKYSKPKEKLYNLNKDLVQFKKDIQLRKISFKYNDGNENIFENFSLKIEKGKSIAFLGKSGSGKTTLINLLCGLLRPNKGEFLVDDKPVNEKITNWQQNIGLISQDNYLIDDTLTNNIVFLNEGDTINKAKLNDAVFYSGVSEFLDELKNGLETKVGEKGSVLSGGQIQRIGLARLLYRDPEVFILDEFTNSLDPKNEDFILEKLRQLQNKKNKTYVIISHKLKPLKICDEIMIMEKGKVSEKLNYTDFYNKYHLLYD